MFSFFKRKEQVIVELLEKIEHCKHSVPETLRQIAVYDDVLLCCLMD